MPTKRPRHAITETDDVEALDALRADTPAKRRARERMAEQMRNGTFDPGTDLDAAIAVKRPRVLPPPLDAPPG